MDIIPPQSYLTVSLLSVEVFTLAPPLMLGTMIKFVEDGGTKVEVRGRFVTRVTLCSHTLLHLQCHTVI